MDQLLELVEAGPWEPVPSLCGSLLCSLTAGVQVASSESVSVYTRPSPDSSCHLNKAYLRLVTSLAIVMAQTAWRNPFNSDKIPHR